MADCDLRNDALSVTTMPDGQEIIVLPNDHPLMVERHRRYEEEAKAKRDACRIDATHVMAGDYPPSAKRPYLNGQYVADVTECYLGEAGWVLRQVRDENGHICLAGDDVVMERLTGHVELRDG